MCILHCIMALGRLVVEFPEALCSDLDKVLRVGVQSIFSGAHTRIRRGSAASPNGEDVYRTPRTSVVALYWSCTSCYGSCTAHGSMSRN